MEVKILKKRRKQDNSEVSNVIKFCLMNLMVTVRRAIFKFFTLTKESLFSDIYRKKDKI